jgi:F-type H+-transporting ATPase subunit b
MLMSPVTVPCRRLVRALVASAAVLIVLAAVSPVILAVAQPIPPGPPAAGTEPAAAHGAQVPAEGAAPTSQGEPHGQAAAVDHGEAEGGHAESPWAVVARIFNFAILAGTLVYLLRSPLMGYLTQRGIQVRSELTKAAALRKEASAQIAGVEAKMKALPDEVEALKRRGAEEIAAEEARIRNLADAERRRLLEQAERQMATELRLAERELKKRAGELAVDVATARVKRTITDRDHARLVDQYVSQVRQ